MRTESLRELASFFVRFLRKGGAIVYAACCASRGGGVRLPRIGVGAAAALWRLAPRRRGGSPLLAPRAGVCAAQVVWGLERLSLAPGASSSAGALVPRGPVLVTPRRRQVPARRVASAGERLLQRPPHVSGCVVREGWIRFGKFVFARYGLV